MIARLALLALLLLALRGQAANVPTCGGTVGSSLIGGFTYGTCSVAWSSTPQASLAASDKSVTCDSSQGWLLNQNLACDGSGSVFAGLISSFGNRAVRVCDFAITSLLNAGVYIAQCANSSAVGKWGAYAPQFDSPSMFGISTGGSSGGDDFMACTSSTPCVIQVVPSDASTLDAAELGSWFSAVFVFVLLFYFVVAVPAGAILKIVRRVMRMG